MPGRRGYIWKGGGQAGCSGPIFHARYHFISEWEDLDREIRIGKYLKSQIEVNLVCKIDKKKSGSRKSKNSKKTHNHVKN